MHHLGANSFINSMKKVLILTILGLIWCSSSYSEIYIFYKQYINKLKEIELDYKQCLKSENIITCNKVIQEHKKIKSHTKFKKFFSSDKCMRECRLIASRLNFYSKKAISLVEVIKMLENTSQN